ncbi:hypothetical protein L249_1371 [Ophiocordyceps polyrhachis-furcata BCC 54312]|uniref:Uncharacterized protein n=1 Tax=Ophiocordyceps polyrhachis-furcata BCC 54312 TaxID=1330021 RepID=A0A367KYY8_9HYPO|nr:hypothetical protein L249_1371 [Ophiocordyceps polyrhachis-furcata BCC 54312]
MPPPPQLSRPGGGGGPRRHMTRHDETQGKVVHETMRIFKSVPRHIIPPRAPSSKITAPSSGTKITNKLYDSHVRARRRGKQPVSPFALTATCAS